jgi:lauroyl/myristoyl acyltransferase
LCMLPLYRFLARWIPRLPRRLSYTLADVVGAAVYYGHRPTREAVAHNQQRALGASASPAAVGTSTRRALQNLTRTYIDEFRLPAMHADEIKAAVTINGLEFLEAARAKGKGVILASAHYGAPHIVGQLLAILGYPTTVVVEHVQPEALFEFLTAQRSSHGLNLIPIDKPLIGLIRTLRKENGVVGLVVDRDVSGTGVLLPFMGETTRVADGAVQLARRTGSAIVVAFCRRIANHRYEAFILPELDLSNLPDDDAEATRVGTMRLMHQLETFIRTDPSQWIMTTPLWK